MVTYSIQGVTCIFHVNHVSNRIIYYIAIKQRLGHVARVGVCTYIHCVEYSSVLLFPTKCYCRRASLYKSAISPHLDHRHNYCLWFGAKRLVRTDFVSRKTRFVSRIMTETNCYSFFLSSLLTTAAPILLNQRMARSRRSIPPGVCPD